MCIQSAITRATAQHSPFRPHLRTLNRLNQRLGIRHSWRDTHSEPKATPACPRVLAGLRGAPARPEATFQSSRHRSAATRHGRVPLIAARYGPWPRVISTPAPTRVAPIPVRFLVFCCSQLVTRKDQLAEKLLAKATFVQRLNTRGGAAPTTACTVGQTQLQPHTG